jgi:hypothetical protein
MRVEPPVRLAFKAVDSLGWPVDVDDEKQTFPDDL